MVHILDDAEWCDSLDRKGYFKSLTLFPEECIEGLSLSEFLKIDHLKAASFNSIILIGSNESAVAGFILRDWLLNESHVPIYISRDSELPIFVDDKCLVIALSNTGDTFETLNAFNEAVNRKCNSIVIASGGELLQLASDYGYPYVKLPGNINNSESLPYQLFTLATIVKKLGLLKEKIWELDESIRILEEIRSEAMGNFNRNFIKKLAVELEGYTPLIYGPQLYRSIIRRMCSEFNLNSKLLSSSGFFPEYVKNGIMVMESSNDNLKRIGLIIIRDAEQEKTYLKNLVGLMVLANERLGKVVEIESRGKGRLSRMLSMLYIGEFLSYYLAMLYGKDPSSIETVRALEIYNQ